jgi:hypothetical protein
MLDGRKDRCERVHLHKPFSGPMARI